MGMANGNCLPGSQRSRLPMTNCFPDPLPWGCRGAKATSGHHLPSGIPGRLSGHPAGLSLLPWWRTEAGITTGRRVSCYIPDEKQRRSADPPSFLPGRAWAKPAPHAHLTSFGLSEAWTSGAGSRRTRQGRSGRRGNRTRRLIAEGIAVARGQTQTRGNEVRTQRISITASV